MSADHRVPRTRRPGTAAEDRARPARPARPARAARAARRDGPTPRAGRRRRPATVAAVVGFVLATTGSVHLVLRTGGADLLDGRTGPVLLVALPYLLLVLGIYWALFDHDEPSERPHPSRPPTAARED